MRRAQETFFMVKIIQEQWDPPIQRMEPKGPRTMKSELMLKWKSPFPVVVTASWQTAIGGFSFAPDNRCVLYLSFLIFFNTVICKSSQIVKLKPIPHHGSTSRFLSNFGKEKQTFTGRDIVSSCS